MRNQPCKKQDSPFFSSPSSDSSSLSDNILESNNKVLKSTINPYEVLSPSSSHITSQNSKNHHNIIKKTLQQRNRTTYNVTLQNTTKSMQVQSKLSNYFVALAKQNQSISYEPPNNCLPAQSMFHLSSKIKKANMTSPNRLKHHQSESSSSTTSHQAKPTYRCSSPYKIRPTIPTVKSDRIQAIMNQDVSASSMSDQSSHDSEQDSEASISEEESQHSEYSASSKSADRFEIPYSSSKRITRASKKRSDDASPSASIFSSQSGTREQPEAPQATSLGLLSHQNSKNQNTSQCLSDAEMLAFLNVRHTPFRLDSSSASSSSNTSQPQSKSVSKRVKKELLKHSKLIKEMLQSLKSDSDTYATLQNEYDARDRYIRTKLEELSNSEDVSRLSSHQIPCHQSMESLSSKSKYEGLIPSQIKCYHKQRGTKHRASLKPKPFTLLNFAGGPSDATFITQKDLQSSDATLQKHYADHSNTTINLDQTNASIESTSSISASYKEESESDKSGQDEPSSTPVNSQDLSPVPNKGNLSLSMPPPSQPKIQTQSSSILAYAKQFSPQLQQYNKEMSPVEKSSHVNSASAMEEEKEKRTSFDQEEPSPVGTQNAASFVGDNIEPSSSSSASSMSQTSINTRQTSSDQDSQSVILSMSNHNDRFVTPSQIEFETAQIKQSDTIRIIGQNCRGAFHKGNNASHHYVPSMESLKGYGADMICLSETNTDWRVNDNYYEAHLLNRAIWNPCPTRTTVSSCKWANPTKTNYQVGGVMTLCVNNLVTRIKTVYNDPYGRFTKTTFIGKNGKFISVYNVYRTHHKSLKTAGIDTPWMHQWECLKSTHEDCDPRKICIEHIIHEVQKGHENDEFPIIFGDFNEDLQDPSNFGIHDLMATCDLKQIYETKHGVIPSSRLNDRQIYHVFVSTHLEQFVTRLGVLSPEDGFNESDHIPFFVDFRKDMFDFKQIIMPNVKYRKLRTHDAPSIERYNCQVKDQMHHHNVLSRLLNLKEYIKHVGFDATASGELEKLDTTMTSIRLRSEDKLWPDPSRFKHATIMDKTVDKIRLLQSIKRAKKGNRSTEQLEKRLSDYDIETSVLSSDASIAKAISESKQDLKFLHEEEDIVRDDHLDQCYEKAVELHAKKKASIIKNMKEREKQRRSWEKIRFATSDNEHRGIDRLGLPMGFEDRSTKDIWDFLSVPENAKQTGWVFTTDKDEIEERLFEWQKLHFGQAGRTPMASNEWHEKLDPVQKNDEEMDVIMTGEIFKNSTLPIEAKCFLRELISNVQPKILPEAIEISTERYQKFYKKARESTSSSPSGLHLGHWKAAAFDKDVSMVLSLIIQIAVQNEYTLERWERVVTVLMEKVATNPWIHKFRTLHLVESDFNFVLRFIWGRVFMRHNEDNKSWNKNQYGGRRAIQGQSAALNKTLTMDIIRYYGEPAALVDKDAKACYDRIIPVVLSYALVRLGLPKHLTRFMCKWLSKAKYFLKLSTGITEHSYSSTLEEYIFGTGQGTGWSPPNWGSISDLISTAMDKHAPGMFLYHPDGISFSKRSFDAFVDDVNGGLTSDGMKIFHPEPDSPVPLLQTIYDQIKSNIQFYSRLLYTSGGQLALDKCFGYLLEFQWRQGKKFMLKTSNKYPAIPIDQKFDGNIDHIALLDPDQPRKMLGCITCPDGNTKPQYESLMQKAKTWGHKIRSKFLNKYDAALSYRQGLSPGLEYPLGVSLLSRKQCETIMSQALPSLLNKLGFPKTTAREIVHGPYQYGGLEIPHLYVSQGVQKLQMIIGHFRKNDMTASLLNISLGLLQQEVGLSKPVLSMDYGTYGALSSTSWIKNLWEFLYEIGGSLRFTNVWSPLPAYENDKSIMDIVMRWNIPMETKCKINLCRLKQKVYFLGELFEPSLRRIRKEVQLLKLDSFHNDKFPIIELPQSYQEIWDNALHTIKAQYQPHNILGSLLSFHCFEYRMSIDFTLLFKYKQHKRIQAYERDQSNTGLCFKLHPLQELPSILIMDSHAARVVSTPIHHKIISHRQIRPMSKPSSPLRTFKLDSSLETSMEEREEFRKYIKDLDPAHQRTIGDIYSDKYIRELAQALSESKMLGVGDASVKWKKSGHSYILETKPERFFLRGVSPVDCAEEAITSNRGEGCTVLAICYITQILCTMFSIQEGQIDIFCDNMEALRRRPPHLNSYTRLSRRDIDIKMELEAIISTLPVEVTLQHVPGHADEHPDFIYDKAPQHVRRNIDMHNCVTEFMDNTPAHLAPRSEAPFYPEQKIALFLRGHIIVDDMIDEVLLHEHGSIMESRMTRKMQIDSSIQHVIDWEAFQQAFKKLNLNEKSTTTKIVHQMWPTQTVLNDRKRGVRALCLRCKNCDEDFDHVFQCRQVGSMSAFRNAINSFSKELTKFKTAKPIQNALISILVAYQQCTIPVPPPHALGRPTKLSVTLQTVFKHQMLLGSHSLSMGYLSYKWSYLHNMYTKASDPEKCKDESIPNINWSSKIIAALWRLSSSVWRSRCKAIHIKDKNKDESLCVEELRQSIRAYLRLSRRCLSSDEKKLHINVARHMKKAYPTTLARWLRLLSTERELTIRKKREERIRKGGLQPLTKFFRKKRSP